MPSNKLWRKFKPSHFALAALGASVVLFGVTQHVFFALTTFAAIAASFYFESRETKDSVKDLTQSLLFAFGAWVFLTLLLNTTSPVNIITSCSMLPGYERGDLIFLAGGPIQAQVVNIQKNLANILYAPFILKDQNGNNIARLRQPILEGQPLFEPQIGLCERVGESTKVEACVKSIDLQGTKIFPSKNNSVVVYDSKTQAGLIVHRAYALINATDGTYLLTKGDNNAFLDQQTGFNLIKLQPEQRVLTGLPFLGALTTAGLRSESDIPHKGNIILRIPYIGYIKLLVFLQIQAPAGCESVLKG